MFQIVEIVIEFDAVSYVFFFYDNKQVRIRTEFGKLG